MIDDNEPVEITVKVPDQITAVCSADDLLRAVHVSFNGRTYPLVDVLRACMPMMDQVEAQIDNIRAFQIVTGKRFAPLETDA